MKEAVLIKSFSNGIALHLDAEMPFEVRRKSASLKQSGRTVI